MYLDNFLRKRLVVLYREEISSLVSIYDEDFDGKLSWNEFLFLLGKFSFFQKSFKSLNA